MHVLKSAFRSLITQLIIRLKTLIALSLFKRKRLDDGFSLGRYYILAGVYYRVVNKFVRTTERESLVTVGENPIGRARLLSPLLDFLVKLLNFKVAEISGW